MKKIKFITEIASSHQGNFKNLIYLTEQHLKLKSDFLKYQIFKTKNLIRKKTSLFDHYKRIEISFSKWEKIIKKYQSKTNLILEPFDLESYKFCKKFKKNVDIKISTSECDNIELISDALKNFKKVFINFSGLRKSDIIKIIKIIKIKKNKKKIILMYGFQSYPTNRSNLRLDLFKLFKNEGFQSGYADHSKYGINKNLINTCKFVISKKCKYIEKHVCIDLNSKPLDYETSINIQDFNFFRKEVLTKNKPKKFNYLKSRSHKEIKYSLGMHKFAFAKNHIKKGDKINLKQIEFFRSPSLEEGLTRLDFYKNRVFTKKNIPKNKQVYSNMIFFKKINE